VASALGLDGVDLEIVPEERGEGVVRSAGLRLRSTTVLADGIPQVLPPGSTVTIEVVLGQATAAAGAAAARPVTPDPASPSPTDGEAVEVPAGPAPALAPPAVPQLDPGTPGAVRAVTTTSTRLERWSVLGPYLLVVAGALGLAWSGGRFRTRGANP